ncbi:MAG: CPBP family intramembrane metalloprotease, partial [Bacteroidales bacterium]|nr:CPBP family intramembrane metalloprotease [Bacteroidales bacterium]
MDRTKRRLAVAVGVAAVLWFLMFSPWTKGILNFWVEMSLSAVILTALGVGFSSDLTSLAKIEKPLLQIAGGVFLAFLLWGIFWVGDKASSWMFGFARDQVDLVYSMKTGLPPWAIALLLLFVIGPAEEFFWRGYVQRTMCSVMGGKRPEDAVFVFTTLVYALVHIWSLNFMLVMAALVAGAVWGLINRICP